MKVNENIFTNIYKKPYANTTLTKLGVEENFKNSFATELEKAKESIQKVTQHDHLSDKKQVDEIKLKEQTDAFEAFMIKNILDISLKTENSLYGKDAGDEIYNSMYNDAISKSLSGGLGFSELLFNFLKERL